VLLLFRSIWKYFILLAMLRRYALCFSEWNFCSSLSGQLAQSELDNDAWYEKGVPRGCSYSGCRLDYRRRGNGLGELQYSTKNSICCPAANSATRRLETETRWALRHFRSVCCYSSVSPYLRLIIGPLALRLRGTVIVA